MPSSALIVSASLAGSMLVIVTVGARPVTATEVPLSAIFTASFPLVALTITWSVWPSPALPPSVAARSVLTVLTSVPARLLTVTVSGPPRALKSTFSTPAVSIVMVALGAEEAQPVAVRRQIDLLGRVGAVEEHRVGAVLALDGVAAVARIPDEGVVAGPEDREVVAAVAVDRVVAGAAAQRLDALAAGDRVVLRPAVERQGDRLRLEAGGRDGVVAAKAVDVELVVRLLVVNRRPARPGRSRRRRRRLR